MEGEQINLVSQAFKICMKPAECKSHKKLSITWDHDVATFGCYMENGSICCQQWLLVYFEPSFVSFTETTVVLIITIILLIFSFECNPSSLVNQVYFFYPSSSIDCTEIAVTFLSAVNNYCDYNLVNVIDFVERTDAVIGGGQAWQRCKTWH